MTSLLSFTSVIFVTWHFTNERKQVSDVTKRNDGEVRIETRGALQSLDDIARWDQLAAAAAGLQPSQVPLKRGPLPVSDEPAVVIV